MLWVNLFIFSYGIAFSIVEYEINNNLFYIHNDKCEILISVKIVTDNDSLPHSITETRL